MKNYAVWAIALAALPCRGQVEVGMRLPVSTVLHMEPVVAAVTIANKLDVPLEIGETGGNTRLFIDIEAGPGTPFLARTDVPMFETPAVVHPEKSATLEFNLLRLYALRAVGSYSVTARLQGPGGLVRSGRRFLDVVPGLLVASVTRPGPDGDPFRYQLRSLARDRMDHLFLRIDDGAGEMCHGVYNLGTLVRVVDPVFQFDRLGQVHVLHQSSPTRFTHSVFDLDGTPYRARFWSGAPNSVSFQLNEDGEIVVAGAQPYRGDTSVAPMRIDMQRVQEMLKRKGAPSRHTVPVERR